MKTWTSSWNIRKTFETQNWYTYLWSFSLKYNIHSFHISPDSWWSIESIPLPFWRHENHQMPWIFSGTKISVYERFCTNNCLADIVVTSTPPSLFGKHEHLLQDCSMTGGFWIDNGESVSYQCRSRAARAAKNEKPWKYLGQPWKPTKICENPWCRKTLSTMVRSK